MRICILAGWGTQPEEGMRKTAWELANRLEEGHQVLRLNPHRWHGGEFWKRLLEFRPTVVHQIGGPSMATFAFLSLVKATTKARTVLSAIHPRSDGIQALPRHPWVDLILVQSARAHSMLQGLSREISWLSAGVDTDRFVPVGNRQRTVLRERYGFSANSFVVLHVGNARRSRNLKALVALASIKDCAPVVVASPSLHKDRATMTALRRAGCRLLTDFIPAIEEIFGLANCYVFPVVTPGGAVDMPLSILEAMSCDLPIVTTGFGGLPDFFEPSDIFRYVTGPDELSRQVLSLVGVDAGGRNRSLALAYDWSVVVERLEGFYAQGGSSSNGSMGDRVRVSQVSSCSASGQA